MPEGVVEHLEFDASDAERQVDALGRDLLNVAVLFREGLEEAFAVLADIQLPEIDPAPITDAITTGVEDAVAGIEDVEVPITADTSGAEQAVDSLVAEADRAEATITVEADTADALAAVEDLSSAVEEASGFLETGTSSAQGFGVAAGVAAGSADGLADAAQKLSPKAAGAVTVVGALAATVGLFFKEAVDAEGATQRYESTLGRFADQVDHVDIGGLNTDLSSLALTLGSDDDKIRSVAARLFELGRSSGIAAPQVAETTEQMIALGARAVALNPELGDVGDVTDALSTALVRGGRFAAKFGLDLSAAEINARALKDTGKETTAELSFYEKAAAGAALATEKYGDNLDRIIARGAENSITVLRRLKQTVVENIEALGAPLTSPIFELLEDAIPLSLAVGTAISRLAEGALPVFVALLDSAVPIANAFLAVLEAVPPEVLAAAVAFTTMHGPLGAILGLLALLPADVVASIAPFISMAAGVYVVVKALKVLDAAMTTNPWALAAVAIATVVTALSLANNEVTVFQDNLRTLARSSDAELGRMARRLAEIRKESGELGRVIGSDALKSFKKLAEDNAGAAERWGQALVKAGVITEKQYVRAIDSAVAAHQREEASQQRSAELYKTEAETAEEAAAAIEEFTASFRSAIPEIGLLFDQATSAAQEFGRALTPAELTSSLDQSIADIASFQERVKTLLAAGLNNIAALVLEKGPVIGGAFARTTLEAGPDEQRALDERLGRHKATAAELERFELQDAGPRLLDAAKRSAAAIPPAVGAELAAMTPELAAQMAELETIFGRSPLENIAAQKAQAATDTFNRGLSPLPGETGDVVRQAGVQFVSEAESIDTLTAGIFVGSTFAVGVAGGIDGTTWVVVAAAERMVRAAERAARKEAESESPSKLFARLGRDLTLGVAGGQVQAVRAVDAASRVVIKAAAVPVQQAVTTVGGPVDNSFHAGPFHITEQGGQGENSARGVSRRLRGVQAFRSK